MKHLVHLTDLNAAQITAVLDRAQQLGELKHWPQCLAGRHIANLFFEASTRTRASFELAANRLGGQVTSLGMHNSSVSKGETMTDTFRTLQSMGFDGFIVRTGEAGVVTMLSNLASDEAAVINAGEANIAHPTQGLLDALTIRQHKGDFAGLAVAIVGDVAHSRVARSALQVLSILGCKDLRIVAPPAWQPAAADAPQAVITDDMTTGVSGCDVVMALRIQNERLAGTELLDKKQYIERYRLDERFIGLAKSDAIVMHPGPINRGVEISDAVADGHQAVIWQQVRNGVSVRAAVFESIARARGWATG